MKNLHQVTKKIYGYKTISEFNIILDCVKEKVFRTEFLAVHFQVCVCVCVKTNIQIKPGCVIHTSDERRLVYLHSAQKCIYIYESLNY
jgi:hypothetical protein